MDLYKSVLIGITMIVLSSCTNLAEQPSIPTPDIGIDAQSGKYLDVTAPNGWNSFKTNEQISLMIRNVSDQQISSGQDFGARIFVLTNHEWVEVKNKTVYTEDPIILEPSQNFDPTKIAGIFVLPELPDTSVSYYTRIFIIGTLIENGKEAEKVASYIDIRLNP